MDISPKELKMKLTKTQEKIITELKKTIAVLSKYNNFSDFFNNSKGEQHIFTTAQHCNGAYNSTEKYQAKAPSEWAKMEKTYNDAVNEHIIIVYAKTESVEALQRAGLIEIIEEAKYNGGYEKVKIIA